LVLHKYRSSRFQFALGDLKMHDQNRVSLYQTDDALNRTDAMRRGAPQPLQ
jgi:hypothetical protein